MPIVHESFQLNFIGVTVERDRRYIHLSSNRHIFAPVAIGGFSPPKQVGIYLDRCFLRKPLIHSKKKSVSVIITNNGSFMVTLKYKGLIFFIHPFICLIVRYQIGSLAKQLLHNFIIFIKK